MDKSIVSRLGWKVVGSAILLLVLGVATLALTSKVDASLEAPGAGKDASPTTGCGAFRILMLTTNGRVDGLLTQLQTQSGVGSVDIFTATTSTPSLTLLQGYDIVVTVMGLQPADPAGVGNVLASYVDGNGVVVQSTRDWYTGNLGGRWVSQSYSPLSTSSVVLSEYDYLGLYDPSSPLMRGMEEGGAFQYRIGDIDATTGAVVVARYQIGGTLPLVAQKGRVVAINGTFTGGVNTVYWSGQWSRVIANAGNLLHNCPTSTATPTATRTAIASSTPTRTSTSTLTPTNTETPTPTVTGTPPTATNTSTPTLTPTITNTPTVTDTPAASPTDAATSTPSATATPTQCAVQFTDVPANSTFHPYIRCLACRGVMGGYADETFRPDNLITRGQIAKIVSNAAALDEDPGTQLFEDVSAANSFYTWINRLSLRGYMGGYPCGGEGEPCGPENLPYFRPFANATRGQIAKIVSNAAGFTDTLAGRIFEDVPPQHPFYIWVQRLASRGYMGGYPCGGDGEPCTPPDNLPYFRPASNATRGQVSKIVSNTFFPGCQTP